MGKKKQARKRLEAWLALIPLPTPEELRAEQSRRVWAAVAKEYLTTLDRLIRQSRSKPS